MIHNCFAKVRAIDGLSEGGCRSVNMFFRFFKFSSIIKAPVLLYQKGRLSNYA